MSAIHTSLAIHEVNYSPQIIMFYQKLETKILCCIKEHFIVYDYSITVRLRIYVLQYEITKK